MASFARPSGAGHATGFSPAGEPKALNRNYFNAKIWKPALTTNAIPPTRDNGCHALRHFYASVLLDAVNPSRPLANASAMPTRRSLSVPTPTSCPPEPLVQTWQSVEPSRPIPLSALAAARLLDAQSGFGW